MYVIKENQRQFGNFAEVLKFLALLNDDVDTSKSAPNYALFSKSQGIVSGVNLVDMFQKIHDVFGIRVVPRGCIEFPAGYILTFEEGYLERVKPEEKQNLSEKTKAELLAIAKEKGLDVSSSMKKEEILSAILAA